MPKQTSCRFKTRLFTAVCVFFFACPHRVECLQLHYDLELCHLGAATDANALRAQRRDWQTRLNTQIHNICLELVVNIFR